MRKLLIVSAAVLALLLDSGAAQAAAKPHKTTHAVSTHKQAKAHAHVKGKAPASHKVHKKAKVA